jgi:hypothetical protein
VFSFHIEQPPKVINLLGSDTECIAIHKKWVDGYSESLCIKMRGALVSRIYNDAEDILMRMQKIVLFDGILPVPRGVITQEQNQICLFDGRV